jgi:CRISPR-associated protein Cas1
VIKRTIEISREPAHLTVRLGQLLLRREEQTVASIPCEDIGVVLVDHAGTTYSHAALMELAASGAAVVVCGRDHLPTALLLPLADHSQVVWRLHEQIAVSRPLRKRLWRQLVQAKIRAQATNLPPDAPARKKLFALAGQVRSGDPSNVEAQAAKVYWSNWLPEEAFRRDADGDALNSLLNYGYAVVRAALGRAIVAAGLVPALGIFHSHRANQFCLADDLIEPLRPFVDARARELYRQGYRDLSPEAKRRLLEILAAPVLLGGEEGPLMVQMHRYVASLVRCYCGEAARLAIPEAVIEEASFSSGG